MTAFSPSFNPSSPGCCQARLLDSRGNDEPNIRGNCPFFFPERILLSEVLLIRVKLLKDRIRILDRNRVDINMVHRGIFKISFQL